MEFRVSRRDFALNPVRNSISIKSMIEKGQISNGVKFLSVAFMPRQSSRTASETRGLPPFLSCKMAGCTRSITKWTAQSGRHIRKNISRKK